MSRRPQKQRRAFTVLRGGGHIESGGAPALARRLVQALRAARDEASSKSVTHPVHAYPARMHPATARRLVTALEPRALLDPFCGSGTTLVEGRRGGVRSVGVDSNPLAIWIARAKTWTAPRRRRERLLALGREIAAEGLDRARESRRGGGGGHRARRPERNRALSGWFAPHVRRELEVLAGQIDAVEQDDEDLAVCLRVALSALLYKVSRRASETDATRVERQIARGATSRLFSERVELLCSGLEELASRRGPLPRVFRGDSRRLSELGIGEAAFDTVITSPPYAGVYDYAEQQRLRLAFFDLPLRRVTRAEIGSRRLGRQKAERALRTWKRDLSTALAEVGRALRSGGRAAVVLGDSALAGQVVRAGELLRDAAGERLELEAWAWEERPKSGRAENSAFGDEPKREHILLFRRT